MGGLFKGKAKKKVKSVIPNKKAKKKKTVQRKIDTSLKKAAATQKKLKVKRAEKLIQKGMGTITVYNVAAETKDYEKVVEKMLLNMDEGFTTSAAAESMASRFSLKELQEQLLAAMESDNAKRLKGFIGQGAQELVVEPVESAATLAEAFGAFLLGEYPDFPEQLFAATHEAFEEEKYKVTHLDEVVEEKIDETTDTIVNGTPEEQGAITATAAIAIIGGVYKKGGNILKNISNKMDVDIKPGGASNNRSNNSNGNNDGDNNNSRESSNQNDLRNRDKSDFKKYNSDQIEKKYGLKRNEYHRVVKDAILADITREGSPYIKDIKRIGNNPDILLAPDGQILLQSRKNSHLSIVTDLFIQYYLP